MAKRAVQPRRPYEELESWPDSLGGIAMNYAVNAVGMALFMEAGGIALESMAGAYQGINSAWTWGQYALDVAPSALLTGVLMPAAVIVAKKNNGSWIDAFLATPFVAGIVALPIQDELRQNGILPQSTWKPAEASVSATRNVFDETTAEALARVPNSVPFSAGLKCNI